MPNSADRRSEPRLSAGRKVHVLVKNGTDWRTCTAFTVNVSENGILVALGELLRPGDRVRVRSCDNPDCWAEATVRHVIPGRADCLLGLQFVRPNGGSPLR